MDDIDVKHGMIRLLQDACCTMVDDQLFSAIFPILHTYADMSLDVVLNSSNCDSGQELRSAVGTFTATGFEPTTTTVDNEDEDTTLLDVSSPQARTEEDWRRIASQMSLKKSAEASEARSPVSATPDLLPIDSCQAAARKILRVIFSSFGDVPYESCEPWEYEEIGGTEGSAEQGFVALRAILLKWEEAPPDRELDEMYIPVWTHSVVFSVRCIVACPGDRIPFRYFQDLFECDCDAGFHKMPRSAREQTGQKPAPIINLSDRIWFQKLEVDAQYAVNTAEHIYANLATDINADLSVVNLQYCKSIEIEIDAIYRHYDENIESILNSLKGRVDRLQEWKILGDIIAAIDERKASSRSIKHYYFGGFLWCLGAGQNLPFGLSDGFLPETMKEMVVENQLVLDDLKEIFYDRNNYAHTRVLRSNRKLTESKVTERRLQGQRVLQFLVELKTHEEAQ